MSRKVIWLDEERMRRALASAARCAEAVREGVYDPETSAALRRAERRYRELAANIARGAA